MTEETPFRIALLTIVLLTMPVGVYFRWRAALSGERISHREEGYLFALALRLAGLGLWAATFGYLLFPQAMAWAQMPLPLWVRWLGVGLGALGPVLMTWTLASLGKNLTDTVVTRADATLVTHGPYRFVRHPFYVTAALLMFSATLISANVLVGLAGLTAMVLLVIRTPHEERRLIAKFGDAYREYMARTGRFLPRIG